MLYLVGFLALQQAVVPAKPSGWSLFSTHCLSCHSQGGSAPLRLDTSTTIARKAATIAVVLRERFMPPWLPTSGGLFHAVTITDPERDAIIAWASAGASDAPLIETTVPAAQVSPAAPKKTITVASGWNVPADGIHMRTFALQSPALPDRVRAVRMTRASAAVERVMMSIDPSGSVLHLDQSDPGDGAHTRGDGPLSSAGSFAILGVDSAWELPNGWSARPAVGDLVVELHATARGAVMPATVHLVFEAGNSTDRLAEVFAAGPLGAVRVDHTEQGIRTDSAPLVVNVEVGALGLRTDERCTSVRVCAQAPDGTERVLLNIPKYRVGLDGSYRFDPPIVLGRGTNIRIDTVHGDHTATTHSKPMAMLWCTRSSVDEYVQRMPQLTKPLDRIATTETGNGTPLDCLTWFDAVAACNARSARDGRAPAYRIEYPERIDGHIVRAQVTCLDGSGWRLPRATEIAIDLKAPAGQWWWTEDTNGLSAFTLVSPCDLRRDALPPSSRIPGVWAGITCPVLAVPAK